MIAKVDRLKTYHMMMEVLSPSLVGEEVHHALYDARRNIGNKPRLTREEAHNIIDDIAAGRAVLKRC